MADKVILYTLQGQDENLVPYIAAGATVDTEWTAITTTGKTDAIIPSGVTVEKAYRYDNPRIETRDGKKIFVGPVDVLLADAKYEPSFIEGQVTDVTATPPLASTETSTPNISIDTAGADEGDVLTIVSGDPAWTPPTAGTLPIGTPTINNSTNPTDNHLYADGNWASNISDFYYPELVAALATENTIQSQAPTIAYNSVLRDGVVALETANNSPDSLWSTDGATVLNKSIITDKPDSYVLKGIAESDSAIVAFGADTLNGGWNYLLVCIEGNRFHELSFGDPANETYDSIAHGNGYFLVHGTDGTGNHFRKCLDSADPTDPTNWVRTASTMDSVLGLKWIAAKNLWYAVGGISTAPAAQTSADGVTFTDIDWDFSIDTATGKFYDVRNVDDNLVLVGNDDTHGGSFSLNTGTNFIHASGVLTFTINPTDGKKVTFNGAELVFKDSPGIGEIQIGLTLSASIDNLIAVLGGVKVGSTVEITGVNTLLSPANGSAGNVIDTGTDVTGASWGAATLEGGAGEKVVIDGTDVISSAAISNNALTVASGNFIVAMESGDTFKSADNGATWTVKATGASDPLQGIATHSNGNVITAAIQTMYTSDDEGETYNDTADVFISNAYDATNSTIGAAWFNFQ